MNNHIRITTLLFMLLVCAALFGTAETVQAKTYGGKCGEDVYWSYDSKTDVLVVSGNGAMTSAPWKDHKDIHTYEDTYFYEMKVVIEEGVTSVIEDAFYLMGVYEVVIGPDVVEIGDLAFSENEIAKVYLSDAVKKLGNVPLGVLVLRAST